jgi:hypothetical protein
VTLHNIGRGSVVYATLVGDDVIVHSTKIPHVVGEGEDEWALALDVETGFWFVLFRNVEGEDTTWRIAWKGDLSACRKQYADNIFEMAEDRMFEEIGTKLEELGLE